MFQIKNARMTNGSLATLLVKDGAIEAVAAQEATVPVGSSALSLSDLGEFARADGQIVDAAGEWLIPGLVDVHVHSRDPGHPAKETWQTLTAAAYQGGVVALCDMPNTSPPTLDRDSVVDKAERARAAGIDFKLYLGVTNDNVERLALLLSDASLPLCGIKVYYGQSTGNHTFSDLDKLAKAVRTCPDTLIVFHSEDQCTIDGNESKMLPDGHGFNHPAAFAVHSAIRSSGAAMTATKAILEWAGTQRRRIHIAHVSTPIEIELIQSARGRGVKVTCEVAPHHLFFSTADYVRLGAFLKMNPPVRASAEVAALAKLFGAGLIDCFATDHAPHTREEKMRTDYHACPSGVPGVDFFAPLLVKAARQFGLGMPAAIAMGAEHPARLFGFTNHGALAPGRAADFVWLKEGRSYVTSDAVKSKCAWTPYENFEVPVQVEATWHRGMKVFHRG